MWTEKTGQTGPVFAGRIPFKESTAKTDQTVDAQANQSS